MEQWKPIPGYEGLYEVSDQGRVRSLSGMQTIKTRWGGVTQRKTVGKVLRAHINVNRGGYRYVNLNKDGVAVSRRVCRLVLAAFIGELQAGQQACHNNGNALDDRLDNLRWGSAAENAGDRRKHGTHKANEDHPMAKLSDEQVHIIRQSKENRNVLATRFAVSPQHIDAIRSGRRRAEHSLG